MVVTDQIYELGAGGFPPSQGIYLPRGPHNGKPSYRRTDSGFFLWWDNVDKWIISVLLGVLGVGHWSRQSDIIVGQYLHQGTYTGDPTLFET